MKNVSQYKTIIFDCDGVILDSNRIKTEAFYRTTQKYGEFIAEAFVEYHRVNGGISRYRKFEHFFSHLLQRPPQVNEMEQLLENYAAYVKEGLLTCQLAEGLYALRAATQNARWLVVSGGDQEELRGVFAARNIDQLFDGGIYGGPDSKDRILAREIANSNIEMPALFIGDSRYDFIASSNAKLDFVFVTEWTEFNEWREFFSPYQDQVTFIDNVGLLNSVYWS